MRMKPMFWACAAALMFTIACSAGKKSTSSPESGEAAQKVAELSQRVDDLDGRLQKIEALLKQALEGPAEPDPEAVYSVPIDGYPSVGPAHAKVTIVKAYEFACGFCFRARATIKDLLAQYGNDIKVVYKPFIVHADVAVLPALAVCAADKQGKFSELETLIWEKGFAERDLGEAKITALAQQAGLDMDRYRKDMESQECKDSLQRSVENLSSMGVSGTPTFYINGRPVVGAQPIQVFKEIIDEELAKASSAIASGTRLENYYRSVVIEGGKKSL